ncbi:MAG: polysaccharide deacetylase family protein [Candidatus Aquicultorales bacterium]
MSSRLTRLMGIAVPIVIFGTALTLLMEPSLVGLEHGLSPAGRAVLLTIALLSAFSGLVTYFEYHGLGGQEGVVRKGPNKRVVAITFDDGPNPKYTPKILDALKKKKVRATFFCVGLHVKKYPDIARRIVNEGHDIGGHTYTHRDLIATTREVVEKQICKTDEVIFEVTGVATKLFRPPRGLYSEAARKIIVDEFGYRMVMWTVSALDWRRDMRPGQIKRRIARYVHPGAILLFHDSGALIRREGGKRSSTVQALPLVIDYLRERGYEIIPVSEMLERLADERLEPRRILERA